MVILCMKWDIIPDKADVYTDWAPSAVKRVLAEPGVTEFRAYRPATGSSQVVVLYEFADFAAWAGWHDNEEVQKAFNELRLYATNVNIELWGPSPVVPEPIRPRG